MSRSNVEALRKRLADNGVSADQRLNLSEVFVSFNGELGNAQWGC